MNKYKIVPDQNSKYPLEIFLTLLIGPDESKIIF